MSSSDIPGMSYSRSISALLGRKSLCGSVIVIVSDSSCRLLDVSAVAQFSRCRVRLLGEFLIEKMTPSLCAFARVAVSARPNAIGLFIFAAFDTRCPVVKVQVSSTGIF